MVASTVVSVDSMGVVEEAMYVVEVRANACGMLGVVSGVAVFSVARETTASCDGLRGSNLEEDVVVAMNPAGSPGLHLSMTRILREGRLPFLLRSWPEAGIVPNSS